MKLSPARLAALAAGFVLVLLLGLRHRGALESTLVPQPVATPEKAPATPAKKIPLPVTLRGGATRDLAAPPGKLLVVHFWATWCAPCVEELPGLLSWWKEAKADPRMELVAVSVDKDWKTVDAFLKKLGGADVPLALDPESATAGAFGTTKFPETYIISPGGAVLHREEGPLDWKSPAVRKMLDGFRSALPSPKTAVRNDAQPGQTS